MKPPKQMNPDTVVRHLSAGIRQQLSRYASLYVHGGADQDRVEAELRDAQTRVQNYRKLREDFENMVAGVQV